MARQYGNNGGYQQGYQSNGNNQPYNECTNFNLKCHSLKQLNNGAVRLNCSIRSKKRQDGTYPAPVWVAVYCDFSKGCQMPEANYNGEAITVCGQLKADSYVNQQGQEVPTLTIFARSVQLTFSNNGGYQQGGNYGGQQNYQNNNSYQNQGYQNNGNYGNQNYQQNNYGNQQGYQQNQGGYDNGGQMNGNYQTQQNPADSGQPVDV